MLMRDKKLTGKVHCITINRNRKKKFVTRTKSTHKHRIR